MEKLIYTTNYTTGGIEDLKIESDESYFRWVRGSFGILTGMNYLDKRERIDDKEVLLYKYFNDLDVELTRRMTDDGLLESYKITNTSKQDIDLSDGEYGIILTFADGKDIARVALPRRAYARVLKSDKYLCVYQSRVNGLPDGVGLVLTKGKLGEYSPCKYTASSVTEHTFNLPPITLAPSESFTIEWLVFYYSDLDEFKTIAGKYMPLSIKRSNERDADAIEPSLADSPENAPIAESDDVSFPDGSAECIGATETITEQSDVIEQNNDEVDTVDNRAVESEPNDETAQNEESDSVCETNETDAAIDDPKDDTVAENEEAADLSNDTSFPVLSAADEINLSDLEKVKDDFLRVEQYEQIIKNLRRQGLTLTETKGGLSFGLLKQDPATYDEFLTSRSAELKPFATKYLKDNLKIKKGVSYIDVELVNEDAELKQKLLKAAKKYAKKLPSLDEKAVITLKAVFDAASLIDSVYSAQSTEIDVLDCAVKRTPLSLAQPDTAS